jgi:solute carrier family 40 (iron-regulated transporter), member 1
MNSQMRRIDLICKSLGPLFIALVAGVSTTTSIIVVFAMDVSSLVIEYYAIALVYHDIPELQEPKKKTPLAEIESPKSYPSDSKSSLGSRIRSFQHSSYVGAFVKKFGGDFSFYLHHRVFLPSIAGALLYMTVLAFGGPMIAFLLSSGYDSTQVGIARTIGVALEISATWLAPWLIKHIGPVRAGQWMSLWQLTMLSAGTMVFLVGAAEPTIVVSGLVIGVILSRIGLVGFDLSIQIIIQEVSSMRRHSISNSCGLICCRKLKLKAVAHSHRSKQLFKVFSNCSRMAQPLCSPGRINLRGPY